MPDGTHALIDHLLAHSVKRGDFALKSGKPTDWFIDAKQTTCRPDGCCWWRTPLLAVMPDDITALGGLTMGADAVAFGIAGIAATRGPRARSFSVRKEVKDHGGGGRIAGALEPGDRVVITEDAVTRGVSMLEAAEVIARRAPSRCSCSGGRPGRNRRGDGCRARPPVLALVTAPDLGFPYEKDVV